MLCYNNDTGTLHMLAPDDGELPLEFAPKLGPYYCYPDVSADGERIVASYGRGAGGTDCVSSTQTILARRTSR
jgi:hypothetical protein